MPANAITKRPPEIQTARNTLRRKGWTQKEAAACLGVTREHLTYVLNARRQSRRILAAIQELPENPNPA
jgi:transcriptional regulator with XRE-family HTH domain